MPSFFLDKLVERSTDTAFSETTLARVLSGLPALGVSGPWLAGGALRRTLLGEEPTSDFDFFFESPEQLGNFAAELEELGFSPVRETEHHIQYRGEVAGCVRDVQLIRFAYYATPQEVVDSFDFTICQFAYDGVALWAADWALWDLGRRRLAINRVTYPVSTMRRLLKYTKQGFTACSGCLSSILKETIDKPELQTQFHITYVD